MSTKRFEWYDFDELDTRLFYDIARLREAVFVVEQACAYPELDDHDLTARHLVLSIDDRLAGYLRLIESPDIAIGRVLIATDCRRNGLAYDLMREGLAEAGRRYGDRPVFVSAQAYLQRFYERLGFVPISDIYDEDGILHLAMRYTLTTPAGLSRHGLGSSP